jgi:hypothetical protein
MIFYFFHTFKIYWSYIFSFIIEYIVYGFIVGFGISYRINVMGTIKENDINF